MAIYIPTKAAVTTEVKNNSNTDMSTQDLDIIISKIAQLKAAPQSAARDSQLQALIADRNAMGRSIWGS